MGRGGEGNAKHGGKGHVRCVSFSEEVCHSNLGFRAIPLTASKTVCARIGSVWCKKNLKKCVFWACCVEKTPPLTQTNLPLPQTMGSAVPTAGLSAAPDTPPIAIAPTNTVIPMA